MESISGGLPPWAVALAAAITLFAGFVKGTIGFAMPLIMISAFGSFMPPSTALAALILPTLVTNVQQAFRQGARAALDSLRVYWRIIGAICVFIVISAQFVLIMPQNLMLGILGVPVVAFAAIQLAGRDLRIPLNNRPRAEYTLGAIGGLYGGISGVWGPPLLIYLISIDAAKAEMVRVQGVVFLIGAIMLLAAHVQTGVMDASATALSAALVVPAVLGMLLGFWLQDRLDPLRFRRWTLVLLLLTGLNLVRRSVMG